MKSISWLSFVILLNVSQCNCEEKEDFTMVYAIGGKIFVKEPRTNYTSRNLTSFDADITDLVMYEDYLYVSKKRNSEDTTNSGIWRLEITNSTSSGIDYSSKHIVTLVDTVKSNILSIAIAKKYIYAGRSDGIMLRCLTAIPYSCEDFYTFKKRISNVFITDLVYNPDHEQIYAVEKVVFPSDPYDELFYLWSCSPDTPQSCSRRSAVLKSQRILYFAFNAVWQGTDSGHIKKCSSNLKICHEFDDFDHSVAMKFGASDKYLYVHADSGKYIWRCDPNKITKPCSKAIKVLEAKNMGPFILV